MHTTIQAVYRNGVLQPLEDLSLEENQQVTVTLTDHPEGAEDASGFFAPDEWTRAACDPITWLDTQQALAHVPGSLSETVIELREER
jgi:predicted DNA-binding antitoxin AbrB/MazE fold protein